MLLDGQAPSVQERLQLGGGIEVVGTQPELDVRGERTSGQRALGEDSHVRGQQEPCGGNAGEHDEQRGGHDAPRPTLLEGQEACAEQDHERSRDRARVTASGASL